jgi:hypothetical protein
LLAAALCALMVVGCDRDRGESTDPDAAGKVVERRAPADTTPRPQMPEPPPPSPDPSPEPTPPPFGPVNPSPESDPPPPADPPVDPPPHPIPETLPDDGPMNAVPAAPIELTRRPPPRAGQWALYRTSAAGDEVRIRRTITAVGPVRITVGEQILRLTEPVGQPREIVLPRTGRLWPQPGQTAARVVRYERERIENLGRKIDCIVLTIESGGEHVRIERQWFSSEAPIDGLVRRTLTVDGREVLREELVGSGVEEPPSE